MERQQRSVFFISDEAVRLGVPTALLGTPFIIGEDGELHRAINEYLLARRNGDWVGPNDVAGMSAELEVHAVLRSSVLYLSNRAYHLNAARRWCRHMKIRLLAITEKQLDEYAEGLEEGVSPDASDGVLPQTVNQYLASIIDFLAFCVARGWRNKLGFAKRAVRTRGRRSVSYRYLIMRTINPEEITAWYTEDDIDLFFDEFSTSSGKLAAKIMYRMGLRISEALSVKVAQFPTLQQFRSDRSRRFIYVVGKFKKRRRVPIDEKILMEIHKYIDYERKIYEVRLSDTCDFLILGRKHNNTSGPMTPRYLQKEFEMAWIASNKSGLTPHMMRHHFATHFLLRAWKVKAETISNTPFFEAAAAQLVLSAELIVLKQALGHSDIDTTMKYILGVSFLIGSDIQDRFAEGIDPS